MTFRNFKIELLNDIGNKSIFALTLFILLTYTHIEAQNNNCTFSWDTYYNFPVPGIDNNAKSKAIEYVKKAISADYNQFSTSTVNSIISRDGIIKTCINNSNNTTTAYASRTEVRRVMTCIPDIRVELSGISDANIRRNIEENARNFFVTIYCCYEQNTQVNFTRFRSNQQFRSVFDKFWKVSPFKCSETNLKKSVSNSFEDFLVIIPITSRLTNQNSISFEYQLSFDKTGQIIDLTINTEINNKSTSVSSITANKIKQYLNNFTTAYFLKKDSIVNILNAYNFTNKQREYITLLTKTFKETGFTNFRFEEISICSVANSPDIYGISIIHGWKSAFGVNTTGYLNLFLEIKQDVVLNTFKWTRDKINPCSQ